MADATIGIVVDPSGAVTGARTVKRSMDDITGSTRTATSAVNMLRSAMASLGLAIGIRQLADWADTWSTIQWRIRNAIGSLQSAEAAMRRVSQVARNTWTSLDQTADAFLRQEAAMSALGYTTRQQLDHIEALNSAILISGLRGQRAEQVSAAWARAMARGTLRGDEFNSVVENSSRLTQALADHLGVSVVELRALAEQGKITSDAMFGITDSLTQLRKEMEGDATLKGALVVLGNSLVEVVGRVDGAIRASSSLGNVIVALADNMGRVASYVGTAAAAFIAYRATVIAADLATKALSVSLATLRTALIRLGIGALVIAAGELVYQFTRLVEGAGGLGEALKLVGDVAREVWQRMVSGLQGLGASVVAVAYNIQAAFIGSFSAVMQKLSELTTWAADGINEMFGAAGIETNLQGLGVEAAERFAAAFDEVSTKAQAAGESARGFFDAATAPLESWEALLAAWREAGADIEDGEAAAERLRQALANAGKGGAAALKEYENALGSLLKELFPTIAAAQELEKSQGLIARAVSEGRISVEMGAEAMERLTEAYEDAIDPLGAVWRELEEERYQLTLSDEQREVHVQLLQIENDLRQAGIRLTKDQRVEIEREIRSLQKARQARQETKRIQEEQGREFNRIVDDTTRYASDLFADLFRETSDGWRGMWQNMRDTMISMLARMAAEAALRPIVVSVLGAMGVAGAGAAAGAAGIGGAGGGGMFGIGSLSDLSSIFNASGGSMMPGVDAWAQANLGFGSIGEMARPTAGFIGPMPAQSVGLLNGGSAFGGFASLGNVLGIAGSALPGLMSGNYAQAGFGAAGAAIGTALLPGIGTAIGGFLGNAVGSLFGGGNKDQEIRPISYAPSSGRGRQTPLRGIELDTLRYKGGGAFKDAVQQADEAIAQYLSDQMVQQVRDFLDARGTIRGKRRDNKAIGEKHIRRALREMYSPVIESLGGTEAAKAFGSMTSSAKPEKVLETAVEVAAFLGRLHDGTLFQTEEISQIEQAWSALHQQFDEVRAMAEKLGQSMTLVEKQIGEAEQAFRDDFNDSIQRAISDLTGGTMAMEQAFRDLDRQQKQRLEDAKLIGADIVEVERLNLLERLALLEQFGLAAGDFATETERASFGIARYGQGMAQFAVNLGQASQRAAGQYRSLITSLQDSLDDLLIGPLSNLNFFEQQRIAEQKFNELAAAALEGSTEAMGKLPEAGRRFLELTAQLYGNAGTSYDAAIKHVIAVQEEAQRAAEQHAREQEQIADHAAQMAQVYQEAMQAVAMAISDGVITPDEVAEIESRFGAVTDAARLMGPAGVLFAEELANVAKMLEDGLLTDNEIAVLLDNVEVFNSTIVDGLLTEREIEAIRIRQDLINGVIRQGTISDEAVEVLRAQAGAVIAVIRDMANATVSEGERLGAAWQGAIDAVADAIQDGVLQPDEIATIRRSFDRVAEAAATMGPAGDALVAQLNELGDSLTAGVLTDNEFTRILKKTRQFNNHLANNLLTAEEREKISARQDLLNDAIAKGTITQAAVNALRQSGTAVSNAVRNSIAGDALNVLRDHATTVRQILRHDTIPRAVIDHLVTQADLIAGTIRGGVFNAETRKVLADRLADLRVLWRDGAPKLNDIKAIQAQVDLARAALVDGVVTSKEVKAIKDQVAMVRNAYKDGVITNSEIKLIQTGTNKLIKEIERIPNAVDHIAARVGDSLALLRGVADQHAAHQRQQAIGQFAAGVGSSAGALVGTNISTPTRRSYNQHRYGKLYDSSSATLNLNTGGLSNWHHSNNQRYNQDWVREWQPVLFGLAQQLQDLVGGKLPSVYIQGHSYGTPTLRVRVGDGNMMEFTNNQLRVPYVGGHFLRQLGFRITGLDSGVAQILRQVDFRPPKDGAQGGLEKLARLLAEAGHVPGFASGGIHAGGWRIVGEQGPELEYTGPSRIYSAPDTNRILASNDNSEVVKELRTLVQQQGRMIEVISAQAAADRADNAALREELAALKRETRQQGRRPNGRAA